MSLTCIPFSDSQLITVIHCALLDFVAPLKIRRLASPSCSFSVEKRTRRDQAESFCLSLKPTIHCYHRGRKQLILLSPSIYRNGGHLESTWATKRLLVKSDDSIPKEANLFASLAEHSPTGTALHQAALTGHSGGS